MGIEDRGFASLPRDRQRELSSKGGKAAQAKGTAYKWNSETARIAGIKGGINSGISKRLRRENGKRSTGNPE